MKRTSDGSWRDSSTTCVVKEKCPSTQQLNVGRFRRAFYFALALSVLTGCEGGPLEEEPEPPVPAWVSERPFPQIRTLHDVVVLRDDFAVAVGTDGDALLWDGSVWTQEDTGVAVDLFAVDGAINQESGEYSILACGNDGVILRRDEDGWRVLNSPVETIVFDVWVRNLNDAFLVGDNGAFLRWTGRETDEVVAMTAEAIQVRQVPSEDDPDVFVDEEYFIDDPLRGVGGNGAENVFAVGPRGLVMRFDGTQWRPEDSGTSRPLASVRASAGLWITTIDGLLLRRNGDGQWEERLRTPSPISLQGMWATGGNDVFVVGLAGRIFHYTEGEWDVEVLPEDVHLRAVDGIVTQEAIDPFPIERTVIAVGAGGRIVRGPLALPVAELGVEDDAAQ